VPGLPDLFTILVILVIVFGAKLLPAIGERIGRRLVRSSEKKGEGSER
jgi:Sec-independent protein translocase protein TatA